MSTVDTSAAGADIPPSATFREVQEIIRTFQRSGWTGMTLELRGLRITVGKHGPPAGILTATPTAAPATTTQVSAVAAAPAVAPPPPPAVASVAAPAAPAASVGPAAGAPTGGAAVDTTGCVAVRSPAVGSFWLAPSPGQPPFVRVGQAVEQDEQLAIVEVMKLMNPVVSTVAGEVVQIVAQNAEMVEYEQILFWIRPSDG